MIAAGSHSAGALYAQVIRADGRRGRRRLVAFHHPNPLRRWLVRALMKLGVF